MSPVVLVADSGPAAGLGHLARSSAIAGALLDHGIEIRAHALGAEAPRSFDGIEWSRLRDLGDLRAGPGLMVLDSYTTPTEATERLGQEAVLAVVSDGGEVPSNVALVVDVGARERADDRWVCGLPFACLRRSFRGLAPRSPGATVTTLLVATGGGDPGGKGAMLAETAARALPDAGVSLLRGPYATGETPPGVEAVCSPASTAKLLREADLIVTTGGQTLLEAAACGIPALVVPVADNQLGNAARVEEAGAARVLPASGAGLAEELRQLGADAGLRGEMAAAGQAAVDGRGAMRVAQRLAALVPSL